MTNTSKQKISDSYVNKKKIKNAEEIYPREDGEFPYYLSGYTPILEEFGEILLRVDEDAWQGDTLVLYEKDGKYGWLRFGWGSCSGCDALQGCSSYKEIQELIDSLESSVQWFESKKEAIKFFKTHDWEGDYDNGEEQQEFVRKAIALLDSFE